MKHSRILLKLSGEALAGDRGYGITPEALRSIAACARTAHEAGAQVGIVIGGGNIYRGIDESISHDRVCGDHMGMLATVINALALKEQLESDHVPCRVMSAVEMPKVAEPFVRSKALRHLEKGRVVIFGGGTGCPYFTTDTTAALRALEIGADVLIKATKVDGVYDRDPVKDPAAVFFPELTYDEVLSRNLKVMDAAAISLCRDNNLAIRVINISDERNIARLLAGESVGSLVWGGELHG